MKYSRQKNIVARSVAGEHLLVPVNECTKRVFTLNKVGFRLWAEIETPRTEDELAESLMSHYAIDRKTARRDVRIFFKEMVSLNLAIED